MGCRFNLVAQQTALHATRIGTPFLQSVVPTPKSQVPSPVCAHYAMPQIESKADPGQLVRPTATALASASASAYHEQMTGGPIISDCLRLKD